MEKVRRDIIVDIDESKFVKHKYNRSHPVDNIWVFDPLEKSNERITVLEKVSNRNGRIFFEFYMKKYKPVFNYN